MRALFDRIARLFRRRPLLALAHPERLGVHMNAAGSGLVRRKPLTFIR